MKVFFNGDYMHFGKKPACIYFQVIKGVRDVCKCTLQGALGKLKRTQVDIPPPSFSSRRITAFKTFRQLPECPIMGQKSDLNTYKNEHITEECARCPRKLSFEQQISEQKLVAKLEDRSF